MEGECNWYNFYVLELKLRLYHIERISIFCKVFLFLQYNKNMFKKFIWVTKMHLHILFYSMYIICGKCFYIEYWAEKLCVFVSIYTHAYTGCKVKSWEGLFLCNRWSQTYTSNYKIGLKNVKIYVLAFLNFKNRFCENYKI